MEDVTCRMSRLAGTIMVIAHRLSTIKDADWIIVLHEGGLDLGAFGCWLSGR